MTDRIDSGINRDILVVIQASQVQAGWKNRFFEKFNAENSVLGTLITRLKQEKRFFVVIGTSENTEDNVFEDVALKNDIECVRGEQKDVANRLLKIIQKYNKKTLIRVSAYSPLVDTDKLYDMYKCHVEDEYDYSYNEHSEGLPMGMGGDIISADALRKIDKMDLDVSQKEFVGLYIRQNETSFSVHKAYYPGNVGGKSKLTIETPKDFDLVNDVLNHLTDISVETVSDYLESHSVLRRYNRENPPREAGVEKLMLNEEKVNSILKNDNIDSTYPISVELTLTNACNLRCVYCSDMLLRDKQGVHQFEKEEFFRLFDDLSAGGTKGVVLEGGGEPTIYPYFRDVVMYARSVGLAVGLITNGTQLLQPEILEELEWIRVSLDASTKEEYLELKGVDAFESVLTNIASYVKNCNTVGVGYVVTNKNISQLEALVLRLRMIGASYIQLRPVVDSPELYPEGIELDYLKYYEKSDFGVEIGGMIDNASGGNNNLSCYAHSVTSIISGDGSVYLCGRLNIYDWIKPIGNIRKQSFREIWNGEERRIQSEMVGESGFCEKNCPQCRISKFNKVFDRLKSVQTVHFI